MGRYAFKSVKDEELYYFFYINYHFFVVLREIAIIKKIFKFRDSCPYNPQIFSNLFLNVYLFIQVNKW